MKPILSFNIIDMAEDITCKSGIAYAGRMLYYTTLGNKAILKWIFGKLYCHFRTHRMLELQQKLRNVLPKSVGLRVFCRVFEVLGNERIKALQTYHYLDIKT